MSLEETNRLLSLLPGLGNIKGNNTADTLSKANITAVNSNKFYLWVIFLSRAANKWSTTGSTHYIKKSDPLYMYTEF